MKNITKNKKTILFASLIVVMILSFSGMNYATTEKQIECEYEYQPNLNDTVNVEEELEELKHAQKNLGDQLQDNPERIQIMLKLITLKEKILTDPDNIEKYNTQANKLIKQLTASLDPIIMHKLRIVQTFSCLTQ